MMLARQEETTAQGAGSSTPNEHRSEIYQLPIRPELVDGWTELGESSEPGADWFLVQLSAKFSIPIPSESLPDESIDDFPDELRGTIELWIDTTNFYVHRFRSEMSIMRAGKVIQVTKERGQYSEFNLAALPGPLPSQ
jgi:hypothetical protein